MSSQAEGSSLASSSAEEVEIIGPPPKTGFPFLSLPLPAKTPTTAPTAPLTTTTTTGASTTSAPGRASRAFTFLKDALKRRRREAQFLSPRAFQRRTRDEELSETDEGILFGVKRKNFRAQLNLSILTFSVTALISFSVLVFAAVMLATKPFTCTEGVAYTGIITTITAAWLPSPTTLVKTDKKK